MCIGKYYVFCWFRPDMIKIVGTESDNFYKIYNGMKKKDNVDHVEFGEFWLFSGYGKLTLFISRQKRDSHFILR